MGGMRGGEDVAMLPMGRVLGHYLFRALHRRSAC